MGGGAWQVYSLSSLEDVFCDDSVVSLSPQASDHQENSLNSVAVAPPLLTVKHYGIGILSSGLKMIVLGFSLL